MRYLLGLLVVIAGCTDAQRSQIGTMGSAATVTCYSGGQVIYSGKSTGKVLTEEHSDGWYFREDGTGNLIRVSGDCVVRN